VHRALLASPTAQRNLVLFLLLAVASACWALILAQKGAGPGVGMAMASPTMGLPATAFLTMWVTMMVAMMFPTAAPMILTFHRIESAKRARGEAFVSTWLFVAGYTLIWAAAGVAAYYGAVTAEAVATRTGLSAAMAARIGGALVIAAGLYQLTPLKNVCLSKCRSPIGFILTSWRGGSLGALRMGLLHGGSCFGCCWLLMVVLFPLGIMNLAAMALITLIIFAEKSLAWKRVTAYGTAAALVIYGLVVVAAPRALPTFAAPGPATAMPGMAKPEIVEPPVPAAMPMGMSGGAPPPARR
jgi:predicted metal-binding membrane protein